MRTGKRYKLRIGNQTSGCGREPGDSGFKAAKGEEKSAANGN